MSRFKYDYYDVDVPGACADSIEELGEVALAIAADRARLYCIPATWTVTLIEGEVGDWSLRFRICRKRAA